MSVLRNELITNVTISFFFEIALILHSYIIVILQLYFCYILLYYSYIFVTL